MNYIFSKHALEQMQLRGIRKSIVKDILTKPDQIKEEKGNKIYQSIVSEGKYLIRIFVDTDTEPNVVITVYKTSKISKYYEGKI